MNFKSTIEQRTDRFLGLLKGKSLKQQLRTVLAVVASGSGQTNGDAMIIEREIFDHAALAKVADDLNDKILAHKALQLRLARTDALAAMDELIDSYNYNLAELIRKRESLKEETDPESMVNVISSTIHHASVNISPRLDLLAKAQVCLSICAQKD